MKKIHLEFIEKLIYNNLTIKSMQDLIPVCNGSFTWYNCFCFIVYMFYN